MDAVLMAEKLEEQFLTTANKNISDDFVSNLEERFLSADEKTGIPNIDSASSDFADLVEDEFKEVELLLFITRDLCRRSKDCCDLILRRGHDDKLKEMYGSESADIVRDISNSLENIIEVLEMITGEENKEKEPKQKEPKEPEEPKEPKEPEEPKEPKKPEEAEKPKEPETPEEPEAPVEPEEEPEEPEE